MSRCAGSNRGPHPSFTPLFFETPIRGLDCILSLSFVVANRDLASLVSRSGVSTYATVLTWCQAFNRYSGFNLLFPTSWAWTHRPTMDALYQLSYNGNYLAHKLLSIKRCFLSINLYRDCLIIKKMKDSHGESFALR